MAYRAPSHPLLTDWARFIDRVKRARDWSATRAFEEARKAGLPLAAKSRTAYLPFEYDREPTDEQAEILAKAFDGWPEAQDTVAAPSAVEPVELARAFQAMTAELEAMRQERLALWRGFAAALASPEGGRVAEALRDVLAPLLPEGARR